MAYDLDPTSEEAAAIRAVILAAKPARKELQRLAKLCGIKANQKNTVIIDELKKVLTAAPSPVAPPAPVAAEPAPVASAAVAPRAAVHSNRGMPLLNEFPLRPGRVTIGRLSQSRGRTRLTIGGGEMLADPLPFSGTAGVIRFDRPARVVMETVLASSGTPLRPLALGPITSS